MKRLSLLLGTDVVMDFLMCRSPFYEKARLLMIAGYADEFELWITAPQVLDLAYALSDGGDELLMPDALEQIRGLRAFVKVFAAGGVEIDRTLAAVWSSPEACLLHESALTIGADAIVTRAVKGFDAPSIKVVDCDGLFEWVKESYGFVYGDAGSSRAQ